MQGQDGPQYVDGQTRVRRPCRRDGQGVVRNDGGGQVGGRGGQQRRCGAGHQAEPVRRHQVGRVQVVLADEIVERLDHVGGELEDLLGQLVVTVADHQLGREQAELVGAADLRRQP